MPHPKDPLKYEDTMFKILQACHNRLLNASVDEPCIFALDLESVKEAQKFRFRFYAFLKAFETHFARPPARIEEEVAMYRQEYESARRVKISIEGRKLRFLSRAHDVSNRNAAAQIEDILEETTPPGEDSRLIRESLEAVPGMAYPENMPSCVADDDEVLAKLRED